MNEEKENQDGDSRPRLNYLPPTINDVIEKLERIESRLFNIENFSDGERNMLTSYIRSLEARIAKLEGQQKSVDQIYEQIHKMSITLPKLITTAGTGKVELFPKPSKPEEPKKVRPRAGKGDNYWIRSTYGKPHQEEEAGDGFDDFCHATGNYFLTKEECQAYCDEINAKALALQRIKDWIMAKGYEFEPDWNNLEGKCWPEYDYKKCKWVWRVSMECRPLGVPFFLRWNDRDKFMRECKEDLNILIGLK